MRQIGADGFASFGWWLSLRRKRAKWALRSLRSLRASSVPARLAQIAFGFAHARFSLRNGRLLGMAIKLGHYLPARPRVTCKIIIHTKNGT
jgi:hypothetical protein